MKAMHYPTHFECMCVRVRVCAGPHMDTSMRRPKDNLRCLPCFCFKSGSLTGLEITKPAGMAGSLIPGTHLSLPH